MNTKIRSRTAFPRMLEETLFKAYQEGKRSVDFLLLFPVSFFYFQSQKKTKTRSFHKQKLIPSS